MLLLLTILIIIIQNVLSNTIIQIYDNMDYTPKYICPYNNNYNNWYIQRICRKEYNTDCEELTKDTFYTYHKNFNLVKGTNNCWLLRLNFYNPKELFENKIQDIIYYLNFSTHSHQFELFSVKLRYNPKFAPFLVFQDVVDKLPIKIILNGGIFNINNIKVTPDSEDIQLQKINDNFFSMDIVKNDYNLVSYIFNKLFNNNSIIKFKIIIENNFMISRSYDIIIENNIIITIYDNYNFLDFYAMSTPTVTITSSPTQNYLRK